MKHLGRKIYHIFGGLVLLSLYYVLGRERALVFYAVLFCLVLAADLMRLKIPAVNRYVYARFGSFIRQNEEHKLTGTTAYILGIGLSLYLFPAPIATAAVCFLACGDVAATSIGERYGKTKIGNKSLEGTAAFFIAASSAGLILPLAGIPVGCHCSAGCVRCRRCGIADLAGKRQPGDTAGISRRYGHPYADDRMGPGKQAAEQGFKNDRQPRECIPR